MIWPGPSLTSVNYLLDNSTTKNSNMLGDNSPQPALCLSSPVRICRHYIRILWSAGVVADTAGTPLLVVHYTGRPVRCKDRTALPRRMAEAAGDRCSGSS